MTASDPVLQNATRSIPTIAGHAGRHVPGERRLRAGLDSLGELGLQRFANEAGVVAEHDRPEAVGEIDVLVPVDVPEPRPGGADGDDRIHDLLPQEAKPGTERGSARCGRFAAVKLLEPAVRRV